MMDQQSVHEFRKAANNAREHTNSTSYTNDLILVFLDNGTRAKYHIQEGRRRDSPA